MHRAEVLDRAKAAVGTRKDQYGSPTQNFERIARRWNAHLVNIGFVAYRHGQPIELTGTDVAMMLVDVKMARLEKDPTHTDSWVDVAGWAACGGEVSRAASPFAPGEAIEIKPGETPGDALRRAQEERATRVFAKHTNNCPCTRCARAAFEDGFATRKAPWDK